MLDYIHQEGTLFHKTQRKTVLLGCSLWTSSEANGSTSACLATHSRHTATVLQQEGTALHPVPGDAGCNHATARMHTTPSCVRGCRVQLYYSKNAYHSILCRRLKGATMLQQEGTLLHPVPEAAGCNRATARRHTIPSCARGCRWFKRLSFSCMSHPPQQGQGNCGSQTHLWFCLGVKGCNFS